MIGLGSIGLALGALSTVTSLIEAATANSNKPAAADASAAFHPAAIKSEHVTIQPAGNTTLPAKGATLDPGVVVPKFDGRTMTALLALQEQHRGH